MQLTQISYVTSFSLVDLQEKVAAEILDKTLEGQVFVHALPLVPKTNISSSWVQPLVFSFQAEVQEES